MSYFRHGYRSFEEFQREALSDARELGKEELELLDDLEREEGLFDSKRRRGARWE